MADKYWVKDASDMSDTNSWSATLNGAGGDGVPGAGDNVYIMQGSADITAGLTALSSAGVESVTVGPLFTGNIGTPGSSMEVEIDNSSDAFLKVQASGGFVYINATGGGINNVEVSTQGGSKLFLTGGTVGTLKLLGGDLEVQNGCDVTTLIRSGGSSTIAYDATAITAYTATGGIGECARPITTADLFATEYLTDTTTTGVTITNLNANAGTVFCQFSGTATNVELNTATISPSGATVSPTFTNTTLNGGTFYVKSGSTEITLSNAATNNGGVSEQASQRLVAPTKGK